jgi:6-phosphogluconolactonase
MQFLLTGGSCAARLYLVWRELLEFQQLRHLDFYFGDERCVSPDSYDSSYGLAIHSLLKSGVPQTCRAFRMEVNDPNVCSAVARYDQALPESIDVLLLGVGEDGHIACLFPGSTALHEKQRRVAYVNCGKQLHNRMTITQVVISHSKSVYLLAAGDTKTTVLNLALQSKEDFDRIPARLVLGANCLFDTPLSDHVFHGY